MAFVWSSCDSSSIVQMFYHPIALPAYLCVQNFPLWISQAQSQATCDSTAAALAAAWGLGAWASIRQVQVQFRQDFSSKETFLL